MRLGVCTLLALSLVCGCGRSPSKPKQDDHDHQQQAQGTKNSARPGSLEDEFKDLKPVPPVPFDKLLPLLPKEIAGFKAEEPMGQTLELGEYKHSHVDREYRGEEKSVTVKIHDTAHIQALYMPFTFAAKLNVQGTDGYQKGITIDGNPGFESFKKVNKQGEMTVLVAKRHLVIINTQGCTPEMLRTVYGLIDIKSLAALK